MISSPPSPSHSMPRMDLQNERDAYVSEIAGRFVIPVLPSYKRTVGIVHDTSRTGKTLYVEPSQVNDGATRTTM